jgi:hypothetical protein
MESGSASGTPIVPCWQREQRARQSGDWPAGGVAAVAPRADVLVAHPFVEGAEAEFA